jgi:hypothetical protein
LPFDDGQLAGAFCLDAFHYTRSKWALAQELSRVVGDNGLLIIPHLHNKSAQNISPGIPLTGAEYMRLFEPGPALLLDEQEILRQLLVEGIFDPARAVVRELTEPAAFTLVLGQPEAMRKYSIGCRLTSQTGRPTLGANPLYRVSRSDSTVRLDRSWADPTLQRECAAIDEYLPARAELPVRVWDSMRSRALEPEDEKIVRDLIQRFVLVHLPRGYAE